MHIKKWHLLNLDEKTQSKFQIVFLNEDQRE
jgi:hypothetical protein